MESIFGVIKRKCNKCGEFKSFSEFHKNKREKHGIKYTCKDCSNKYCREQFKINGGFITKENLIKRIYKSQILSSKRRNHPLPFYTKQELSDWLFNQEEFHEFYENWVKSKFKRKLVPSVDRIDDKLPYFFDNIQLMLWKENDDKAHKDMRSGKLFIGHKPVVQYDKQGNFIAGYVSAHQASRETGINRGNISSTCRGDKKIAGGFKWNFK